MVKVALCFFGLVKDYRMTSASVNTFIVAPLQKQGYSIDIYAHTYKQGSVTNARNQEKAGVVIPTSLATHFPSATICYDNPAVVDRIKPLSYYLQNGDPWPDNPGVSMTNYVRQLYSLKRVTALWNAKHEEYKYIIYLRPDVRFLTPLILPATLAEDKVVVPSFHSFTGYNDRFAYGRPAAMKKYGERMMWLDNFFARPVKNKLHAERYLKIYLDAQGLSVVSIPFFFIRVRAGGVENTADGDQARAAGVKV